MPKKTINLLLAKKEDKTLISKINKYAPVLSISLLLAFFVFYIISLVMVRKYVGEYNGLQDKAEELEARISNKKNSEGLYVTSISILNIIEKIIFLEKYNFTGVLPEVIALNTVDTTIDTSSIDKKGGVSMTLTTSSLNSLENFVEILKNKENSKIFENIYAQGILRDKNGGYSMTILLNTINKKNI